jgi:UDP-glucose 4-epimerase
LGANLIKCLITGGAGFIGSHLSELLLELGHKVVVVDNLSTGTISNISGYLDSPNFKFIELDICNNKLLADVFVDIDWVFHLAALADIVPSIENPESYFNANVVGTLNIAQLSIQNNVKKVVYAASSSCYGIPEKFPTNESSVCDPKYPYALTKYLGEQIIRHWNSVYGLPTISLRLFNVYGPRARTSGTYGAMFGVFLKQKISKMPLTVVGDGNQTRDFTYVTDVAEAFFKAMFYQGNYNIFNIGTGNPISINRIVKLLNCNKITIPKRPGEPRITHANVSLAQKELNWQYKIKIEEGIKRILNEINYWKNAPLWTSRKIKQATKEWFKYLK